MKKAVFALASLSLMATPVAASASVRPMMAVPTVSSSAAVIGENSDEDNDRTFIFATIIGALALVALVVVDNKDEDDVDFLPVPVSGG